MQQIVGHEPVPKADLRVDAAPITGPSGVLQVDGWRLLERGVISPQVPLDGPLSWAECRRCSNGLLTA
jgi:hypothetical protein